MRGTLGHHVADQQPMHQVGLYETQTGVLLKEQIVGEKQNELSMVSEFLTPLWVKGRILSADALHTQKTFCTTVDAYGGFYLLIAKGNQPTLRDDLHLFFSEPPTDCWDWRTAQTFGKGHGRLERRELVATTELNDFLSSNWPGVAQVFRLTRTIERSGKRHQEVVYGLTNLSPALATARGPSALATRALGNWCDPFRRNERKLKDGEQGESSLTTDRVMWGAIPHPLGERGNAAPSR